MKEQEALSLWSTLLRNGLDLRPTQAVLVELQRYSGLSLEQVRTLAERSPLMTKETWEARDRSTPEGVQDFYDHVAHWVYGTLAYHGRQAEGENVPLPVQAAAAVDGRRPGDFLDFGAGVATASLLFAELGWRTTAADVSAPLLDFARWRFSDRGIKAGVIDLSRERLPEQAFDVVCAFNTMVHVQNPAAAVRDLERTLRPGGLLIFDVDARPKASGMPWHLYDRQDPVLRVMGRCGFARRGRLGELHVFERQESGALKRTLSGTYDALRYSRIVSTLGSAYRETHWRL